MNQELRDQKEPGEPLERTVVLGYQVWLELKEHLGSQEQMAYQVFQEREERQASPDNPVPPDWMVPRDHPDSQGSEAETDPQVLRESQALWEFQESLDEMEIMDFLDCKE